MKFSLTTILVAALGTHTALADYAVVMTKCAMSCHSYYAWVDAFGNYGSFDADEGCRNNPGPPGMQSICWDWGNKRGHFYYTNQPRRCMRELFSKTFNGADALARWEEVACTW
jgi:hypothetical protein